MHKRLLVSASTFSHLEHFHLPYIRGFCELGWKVDVACGGEPIDLPYVESSIQVPFQKKLLTAQNWAAARMLRRKIKRCHYDLVITHTALASFFTRMALLWLPKRPKCITVVHGYLFDADSNKVRAWLYKAAERLVNGVTDKLLTMNQYDYAWAKQQYGGQKVGIIPGMGADEARTDNADSYDIGFPDGSKVLVFAAEFSERKNQAMLIRAMPMLPDHVHLVLPGSGALLEQCQALADELGVADRVLFSGYTKDVLPMIKAADIAVSSSRFEGLPFNLIEAMQCALPIVASRTKGNCDLVQEGKNGFLYTYGDVDSYVCAIQKLLNSQVLLEKMGRESLNLAPQYGLKAVYPLVMAAYQSQAVQQAGDTADNTEKTRL